MLLNCVDVFFFFLLFSGREVADTPALGWAGSVAPPTQLTDGVLSRCQCFDSLFKREREGEKINI